METNEQLQTNLTVEQLASFADVAITMQPERAQTKIRSILMDSRLIQPHDVFVALQGETTDGHDYVSKAFSQGAVAAIVSGLKADSLSEYHDKLIIVQDPLLAVQRMAEVYRSRLTMPIIAVTGSNGKTTTRQIITTVLQSSLTVGSTYGNWNNHIGVPLCILHLSGKEHVIVLEMGANHAGEIEVLSRIARPDIGVITNIGYAHVGNFGGLEKTTEAKFEILAGMNEQKSELLLNGDDSRLKKKGKTLSHKTTFYGFSRLCSLRATQIEISQTGFSSFTYDGYRYSIPLPGKHWISSALVALSLGKRFGLDPETMNQALMNFAVDPLRGRIATKHGVHFIVDCYNANPTSMKAAIELLMDVAAQRRRVAIIGDMLELGSYARQLHYTTGRLLGQAQLSCLIAVGSLNEQIRKGAEKSGMNPSTIYCVNNASEALECARRTLKENDIVLLKGSRGIRLETVYNHY